MGALKPGCAHTTSLFGCKHCYEKISAALKAAEDALAKHLKVRPRVSVRVVRSK
jgi:hypothetical protein